MRRLGSTVSFAPGISDAISRDFQTGTRRSYSPPITCVGIVSAPRRSRASWRLQAPSWRPKASGGCGCGLFSIAVRMNSTISGLS